jgi:hypothetical protein
MALPAAPTSISWPAVIDAPAVTGTVLPTA